MTIGAMSRRADEGACGVTIANAQLVVERWMKKHGQVVGDATDPKLADGELRLRLIMEEWLELRDAWRVDDLIGVCDAIADLLVVVLGTAVACGVDAQALFVEVMRSNETKSVGLKDEHGKVLKGDRYVPPDIRQIIEQSRKEALFRREVAEMMDGVEHDSAA